MIDPAWEGEVQFYELFFGTPLSYAFLVLFWQLVLRQPLAEWRYILLTYLGASFFLVNHYFQGAPFYVYLLNGYALVYYVIYYFVAVHRQPRSVGWKIAATLSSVLFTIAYIIFETIARIGVEAGCNEFWFMFGGHCLFLIVIVWRYRATREKSLQ